MMKTNESLTSGASVNKVQKKTWNWEKTNVCCKENDWLLSQNRNETLKVVEELCGYQYNLDIQPKLKKEVTETTAATMDKANESYQKKKSSCVRRDQ